MNAPDSVDGSGVAARQQATRLKHRVPVVIAICCLTIIAALVLGVGLATNLVLRHVIQTAPLWIGVILGFRHSRAATWVALPLFLAWLTLMALIWLYLLGISNLLSGHFAPVEIAMTIIVGAAAIIGIGGFIRFKSALSPIGAGGIFVLMLVIQLACLRVSFLPEIAHR
jgi:hypothetical protein